MKYILNDKDKAILGITTQTNITYAKARGIIETLKDVSVIFSHKDGVVSNIAKELDRIDFDQMHNFLVNLEKMNIQVITYLSDIYPAQLREIHNPPLVLYAKGDLSLLSHDAMLAVVGTRRATAYGEDVTRSFCKVLAKENICIVSGLADGIDTIAHESTVAVKGKTIAVLGSGLNNIYPASNITLADKIVATGGLILSEYLPNETPQSYHFPARNRIVAGLCKGVLIIEAPLRSGALITKEYALENNRDIFVVPGRINDIYSKGSNEVIKSCQGSIVLSPDDVLSSFGRYGRAKSDVKTIQFDMEEQIIVDLLQAEEMHFDKIVMTTGLSPAKVNSILMKLELKNFVKKMPGNMYTMAIN